MSVSVQFELVQVKEAFAPIEDINLKVYFPQSSQNSNLSVNLGEFEFNAKESVGYWTIPKFDKGGVTATLKGNLFTESQNPSCVLQLSCKIEKFSVTGGGITKVNISKNPKNLSFYKGGRNTTYISNLEMIF